MKNLHWTDQNDLRTLWAVSVSFQDTKSIHKRNSYQKSESPLFRGLILMATSKGNNKLVLASLSLTAKSASVATVKATPNAAKRNLFAGDKS
jgi:hypothetical protein